MSREPLAMRKSLACCSITASIRGHGTSVRCPVEVAKAAPFSMPLDDSEQCEVIKMLERKMFTAGHSSVVAHVTTFRELFTAGDYNGQLAIEICRCLEDKCFLGKECTKHAYCLLRWNDPRSLGPI